ncbi:unnamed protein product [Kluyveromyces dobzhanskii CBS 2104]|uniref:WGS project CCBQ000000000 data, contig 00041 n=1 Tax=Kluyveromyces dobzhanskii CBS 2104 TaxID=1427455 RepID=A0A0A8L019_9SACH|nr:unnamed protein product [Kluyveromyces dobzhanskii CBS 2104]
MSEPKLVNMNKVKNTYERRFSEDTSSTTENSEKDSFDFTALMKRLKETRKSTISRSNLKYLATATQDQLKDISYSVKDEHYDLELIDRNIDKENDNDTDSDIELSWRPLDEIELKRRQLCRNSKLFKPMAAQHEEFTSDMVSEKCAKLLGYPLPDHIKLKQGQGLEEYNKDREKLRKYGFNDLGAYKGNDTAIFNDEGFNFIYPVKETSVKEKSDIDHPSIDEVLQSIKENIQQTRKKVDNLNTFIQSRITADTREENKAQAEKEDDSVKENIPGVFPERVVYLNHFVDPPEKQPTYFSALTYMKWIVAWPIKWKLAYFVTYHILSFSEKHYTFSGKSQNLVSNTHYLTLDELDMLLGCYMTHHVITRNLYDVTFSVREIYDYAYQYFMQYDELHPILKKYWKELFIYGLLNVAMISIGAATMHLCLAPGRTSSPVYTCLWNIGFGASQRVGFAIMLIIFYLDLTQEGLNRFKKQADHLKEQEQLLQSEGHKKAPRSANTAVFENTSVNIGVCPGNVRNDSILLESTPPMMPNLSRLMTESPLLKKSINVEGNGSIKLVSISSIIPTHETQTDAVLDETSGVNPDKNNPNPVKILILDMILRVLVFTSNFLQQPVKTTRKLLPYKLFNSVKKVIRNQS